MNNNMVNPIINHRYWYRDNRNDNIHWSHPLNIKYPFLPNGGSSPFGGIRRYSLLGDVVHIIHDILLLLQ